MNDVPLIQRIDVNSINTSIIAIKKQLKQIEQMLGGIGGTELPTDILYRKDVADAVQEGNNNPVSSGAVDDVIKSLDVNSVGGSGKYISAIEEVDGKINATASNLSSATVGDSDKVDGYHVSTASGTTKNDALNALVPVVKQYFTSTSGYIVYANGLKIQWGRFTSTTVELTPVVNLLVNFDNANYTVETTTVQNDNYIYRIRVKSKNNNNFTTCRYNQQGQPTNSPFDWIAIGY